MNLFFCGVGLVLLGGVVSAFLPGRVRMRAFIPWALAGGALQIATAAWVLAGRSLPGVILALPDPIGSVRFALDPAAAFFSGLVALGGVAGAVFGSGYLLADHHSEGKTGAGHPFFLALLLASMSLLAAVHHAAAFFFLWEVMTMASFFLVAFEDHQPEVVSSAVHYLVSMQLGAAFLIAAFAATSLRAGSFDFAAFPAVLAGRHGFSAAMSFLFLTGFGMKAGLFPLHAWLPRAHPAAPSHVSGLMSGLMLKTGLLGLVRVLLWTDGATLGFGFALLALGAVSAVYGVSHAALQRDIKKALAYSSVENVGIMTLACGAGTIGLALHNPVASALGFGGAFLHILNHSIFKSLLFFGAGSVYRATGTRDSEKMGGLARRMPVTSNCFLAGSIAAAGLPPFNGFTGEFLAFLSLLASAAAGTFATTLALVPAVAFLSLTGIVAALAFTRLYGIAFLGAPRSPAAEKAEEVSFLQRLPLLTWAGLCLLLGLFPQFVLEAVSLPIRQLAHLGPGEPLPGLSALSTLSIVALLFCGLFLLVFLLRTLLCRGLPHRAARTWDCGYDAGTPRMQYTGASFASSFVDLARPFVYVRVKCRPPAGLFPTGAQARTRVEDLAESRCIAPAVDAYTRFLERFAWIQSGSTQRYILYGLLFLVVTLLVTAGGVL